MKVAAFGSVLEGDTLIGFVPVERVRELDDAKIPYQVVTPDDRRLESYNNGSSGLYDTSQGSVDETFKSPEGCETVWRMGDEAYAYTGSYALPGSCGDPAVELSPSWIEGGWCGWIADLLPGNCADEVTSVRMRFQAEAWCDLPLCTAPEVGCWNQSAGEWEFNWNLPFGYDWTDIDLTQAEIDRFVIYALLILGFAEPARYEFISYGDSLTHTLSVLSEMATRGPQMARENPDDFSNTPDPAKCNTTMLEFIDTETAKLKEFEKGLDRKEQLELESRMLSYRLPAREFVDRILRYETTIERQLYRAIDQLESLQRSRHRDTVPPPINIQISNEN